jgi:hypothetical protein
LILAEVSDKEFTATTVILASLVVSSFGYGVVRARKWLLPLAVIPAALWAFLVVPELDDHFVGPAILQELGYGYVALSYLSVICPFIAIGMAFKRSGKQSQALEFGDRRGRKNWPLPKPKA